MLVTATPSGPAIGGGSSLGASPTIPPSPMFIPTPDPTRTSIVDPTQNQSYVVQSGDTLSAIGQRYGVAADAIAAANNMSLSTPLNIGQTLVIPTAIQTTGPDFKIIPDSELVYGPGLKDFSVERFLAGRDCYLCTYTEYEDGKTWTGAEVVMRVAVEQSISPRLLLALLEYQSHWISQKTVSDDQAKYPLGYLQRPDAIYGLYQQLYWAGDMLATGYYGWRERGLAATLLADGTRVGLSPSINAGTAGVEVLLSQTRSVDGWMAASQPSGFFATYVSLFGDPFQYAVEPLIPPDLTQPPMSVPWAADESWYFTGGPHGGWGSGSAWAALDFVAPTTVSGCDEAVEWARAVADGVIARSDFGVVILDLDGDGFMGTGWTVVYMHLSSADRAVKVGQAVHQGDPIGHPACETGYSVATHLHIARRYNGEWIAADCSACMLTVPQPQWNLGGWLAHSFQREYDGSLTDGKEYREACICREAIDTISGVPPSQ